MPGGPINGAANPFTEIAKNVSNSLNEMLDNKPKNDNATRTIVIPTVLQLASDMLNYWTSMTCLYDPYHTPEAGKITLPICMFHVKKIAPTWSVETSKKRVILYEPQRDWIIAPEELANQMRTGVMRTIVDNSVRQPTTYNMEVIVPFQPFGRYVAEGLKTITDLVGGFFTMLGEAQGFEAAFENLTSLVTSSLKLIDKARNMVAKLPGTEGVTYLNMNSLEAMAESCRLLCMKMWTGFTYKFVIITGMTCDKQPLEDDVFRVTLNLQEMPVLSVTRPKPSSRQNAKPGWAASAISASQRMLSKPLVDLTGVRGKDGADDEEKIEKSSGGGGPDFASNYYRV